MFKDGLRPLPKDERDFSHEVVFGSVEQLPVGDFMVPSNGIIKDQRLTDFCGAFSSTAVSEDQEGVELDELWQFAKIKQIMGDYKSWGADLRSVMKSFVTYGSVERKDAHHNIFEERDIIANWRNYPAILDEKAKVHRKQSFFAIDGKRDTFDNIRSAMWIHLGENCSVVTGCWWKNDWNDAPKGVIPKVYGEDGLGHAFKICGQKLINGELHLVAQLSSGTQLGDKGYYYLPREVVNREFTYGSFCFTDMPKEKADMMNRKKISINDHTIIKILKILFYLWK